MNYSDTTPDVTYTYDRLGRQLSAVAADVSTNLYAYSTNTLELVSETQNGVVINRSRDAFGRESGIALEESDYNVSYGYDAYGRFGAVTSDSSLVTNNFTYSYLPGASLVSGMTASTGHAWTRSYEQHRNLITAVTNSFNGNLISAFDYVNDSIGRRTARLDALPGEVAATNAFGYNTRSEVTSAAMGTNTYGYVFDSIGNRITSTNKADVTSYVANVLNQYTAISNALVTLPVDDDDGNMLTNGVWSYVWDGENRLRSILSNEVLLVTYTYDHRSRRIGKVAGETTHSFFYDGWNLILETIHHSSFIVHRFYVWGLDLSGSLQGAGGVGGLLAVISPLPLGEEQGEGSTVYLPCYDSNGNVMEYVSTDGTIVAHYEYSPFGETFIKSGDLADAFAFRFSTKYWEDEVKLYYYGYRFYAPVVGRWLNRDPIGEAGGINVFSTVNNMISYYDVIGLKCCLITMRAGGGSKSGHSMIKCDNGDYISWNPNSGIPIMPFIPGMPITGENHAESDDFGAGSHYGVITTGSLMSDGDIETDKGRKATVVCLDCLDGKNLPKPNQGGLWGGSWNPLNNCSDETLRAADEGLKQDPPKCPCGYVVENILDRSIAQTPQSAEAKFRDLKNNGCNKWKCVVVTSGNLAGTGAGHH